MFKAEEKKQVEIFIKMFWQEKDKINAYIRKNIFALVDKIPELVYNRVRKKINCQSFTPPHNLQLHTETW